MGSLLDQVVNGLVTGLVYALVAAGISLMFRVLDTVNFAHGEFYVLGGVGAYFAATILGVSSWVGLILAAAIPGGLAVALHAMLRPILSRNPMNVLLATFAVSLAVSNLVSHQFRGVAQPVPPFVDGALGVGPIVVTYQRLIAAGATLVILAVLLGWLRRTRTGRSLRAVADNRTGAAIVGINTMRVDRVVFLVSGVTAGVAGALLAPVTQVSAYAGLPTLVTAFVVVVIGGVGSVPGALAGGALLGVIEGLTVAAVGVRWVPLVGYLLLLVVLLLRPSVDAWSSRAKRITTPRARSAT